MIRKIIPATNVDATIHVGGSKSITNRALICAALASGESIIRNASRSEDTMLMINGLNQLGVLVRRTDGDLVVHGTGGRFHAPKFPIPVGNAGTTFRFLLSLAALAEGTTIFETAPRMAERPLGELVNALGQVGVEVQGPTGQARYAVTGGGLRGGTVTMDGSRSSQFLTSILMVAPYARNDIQVRVVGTLSSLPYIQMTQAVMKAFGVSVETADESTFRVRAGTVYSPVEYTVEADASGASYFLTAPAIAGGKVTVLHVSPTSMQGDIAFVDVLRKMGVDVGVEGDGIVSSCNGGIAGVDVDMNAMPDVVPTLAVAALFADSPTLIRNIAQLRHKESDRLEAVTTELSKLGARVAVDADSLEITPAPLHGAQLDTYDDHRLAMSFALVGLRVPGVAVENPQCVKKSFPHFWGEFDKLSQRHPN